MLVLRDGNSTIYPLAKDCADAVRDPQCLDLPPVRCVAAGSLALTGTSHNMKNQVAIVVFALEQQILMPKILRCEVEYCRQVLAQLEVDCRKYTVCFLMRRGIMRLVFHTGTNPSAVQSILGERCDGNRNIFHAVVSMCSPTSNKESDNGK